MKRAIVVIVVGLVLTGCSSSSSKADGGQLKPAVGGPATTTGTIPPATSTTAAGATPTTAVSVSTSSTLPITSTTSATSGSGLSSIVPTLERVGLGCGAPRPYEAAPGDIDLGVNPVEAMICNNGTTLQVQVHRWVDEAARASAWRRGLDFACQAAPKGLKVVWVESGSIIIDVDTGAGTAGARSQLITAIAAAMSTKVSSRVC